MWSKNGLMASKMHTCFNNRKTAAINGQVSTINGQAFSGSLYLGQVWPHPHVTVKLMFDTVVLRSNLLNGVYMLLLSLIYRT